MKTNNLKWGVEFKIWHIYPLIWKSRFLLNPFFWSVYLFFSPPHSFMSSIQYQWNTCNSGMRHHWYVSKQWLYKCSDGWKVRAESQYFSPYFKHPHTPIKKKKSFPSQDFWSFSTNFFSLQYSKYPYVIWGSEKSILGTYSEFWQGKFFLSDLKWVVLENMLSLGIM